MADDHEDGYSGPATLTVDGTDHAVEALLDARYEPHDGRMHWFGRVRLGADVGGELASARQVELSTPSGRAQATIGDCDPWGRYRVTGVGTPPFTQPAPDLDD
jgi:hypothetical protein